MEKSTFTGRDSSGKEHYRAVLLADTTDELPTREWNGIVLEQGSSITSIGEGAEYMMNSAGAWIRQGGGAPEPTLIEKTITENGEYDPADDNADGYSSVSVEVESDPTLIEKSITANGEYTASADNADGYSSVSVDVPAPTLTGDGYVAEGIDASYFYSNKFFVGYYNSEPTKIVGVWGPPPSPPSGFTALTTYSYELPGPT